MEKYQSYIRYDVAVKINSNRKLPRTKDGEGRVWSKGGKSRKPLIKERFV